MKKIASLVAVATLSMASAGAMAQADNQAGTVNDCSAVPTHAQLTSALQVALDSNGTGQTNGGLNFDMWGSVVNRFGVVCAVTAAHQPLAGAGAPGDPDPWSASRVISAQKANTANSLSTDGLALSTANLHTAVQDGNPLFGLQHSNPVDTRVAYLGDPKTYGTPNDSMAGLKIGGVNVFGGGLALYSAGGELVGAIGVSGDTSCADHNIAWRTREALSTAVGVDVVNGAAVVGLGDVAFTTVTSDNIDFSGGGWSHPDCGNGEAAIAAGF